MGATARGRPVKIREDYQNDALDLRRIKAAVNADPKLDAKRKEELDWVLGRAIALFLEVTSERMTRERVTVVRRKR